MEINMGIFPLLLLVICSTIISANQEDETIIDTPQGKLQGLKLNSRSGNPYYAFKGIPYGQADRFDVAKMHPSWSDVRKASEFGHNCPHFDVLSKTIIGDDACLFLNVFSPVDLNSGKTDSKLPVMVWFHGGAFELGRSDDYDAKYLMEDKQVVLVTVNYRLGALGFLHTEDDTVPGNLGLRDQNLALIWVQMHIQAFGGDSKKVTLFGNSAGGASVHFQMMSPSSQGLFRNAISMSGTALCPWALQKQPKLTAINLGEALKCPTSSMASMVDCIKTKPTHEIILAQVQMKKWAIFPFNNFAPVVESKDSTFPAFLDDAPITLMEAGKFAKVPWIVGVVEDEGAIFSPALILNENFTKDLNEDWKKVVPFLLSTDHIESQEKRDEISSKILDFYFGSYEEIGEQSWESLSNLMSDRYFVYPTDKAARLHTKHAFAYPYEFAFPGGPSKSLEAFFGIVGDYGVLHTDELQYLFNGFYNSPEYDETKHEPFDLSKQFVKLWTSFAENSAPTATWKKALEWKAIPKSGKGQLKYYQIAGETSISQTDLKDRMALWNKLDISEIPVKSIQNQAKKEEL